MGIGLTSFHRNVCRATANLNRLRGALYYRSIRQKEDSGVDLSRLSLSLLRPRPIRDSGMGAQLVTLQFHTYECTCTFTYIYVYIYTYIYIHI